MLYPIWRGNPISIWAFFLTEPLHGGNDMLWLCITAAGAGALLGLALMRVVAVFAASVTLAVSAVVLMRLGQWTLLEAIVYTFMLLGTLQFSYLVGFIFSSRWTRNTVTEGSRVHRSG